MIDYDRSWFCFNLIFFFDTSYRSIRFHVCEKMTSIFDILVEEKKKLFDYMIEYIHHLVVIERICGKLDIFDCIHCLIFISIIDKNRYNDNSSSLSSQLMFTKMQSFNYSYVVETFTSIYAWTYSTKCHAWLVSSSYLLSLTSIWLLDIYIHLKFSPLTLVLLLSKVHQHGCTTNN